MKRTPKRTWGASKQLGGLVVMHIVLLTSQSRSHATGTEYMSKGQSLNPYSHVTFVPHQLIVTAVEKQAAIRRAERSGTWGPSHPDYMTKDIVAAKKQHTYNTIIAPRVAMANALVEQLSPKAHRYLLRWLKLTDYVGKNHKQMVDTLFRTISGQDLQIRDPRLDHHHMPIYADLMNIRNLEQALASFGQARMEGQATETDLAYDEFLNAAQTYLDADAKRAQNITGLRAIKNIGIGIETKQVPNGMGIYFVDAVSSDTIETERYKDLYQDVHTPVGNYARNAIIEALKLN